MRSAVIVRVEMEFHQGRLLDHVHLRGRDLEASKRTDNGGPGERDYHPRYYAAYALDPDGNNVEAVFHGPTTRLVDSVIVTPA